MGELFKGIEMASHMLPEILPEILPSLVHAAPEGLSTVVHAAPEVVLHAEPAVSAALHAEPALNAAVHSAAPEAGVIADGTVTARSGAAKVINYNGVAPKTTMESLTGGNAMVSGARALTMGYGVWQTNKTLTSITSGVGALFRGAGREAGRLEDAAQHLALASKQKTEDGLHAAEKEFDEALKAVKSKVGVGLGPAKTALEGTLAVVTIAGVLYVSFEVYMFLKRRSK